MYPFQNKILLYKQKTGLEKKNCSMLNLEPEPNCNDFKDKQQPDYIKIYKAIL